MKCLFAVAFLALVAVAFAEKREAAIPTQSEKALEPVKTEDVKDARDKRGLLVTSYATAPVAYAAYPAPVAYHASYHPAPVAYATNYAVPYAYNSIVHSFPVGPVDYSPTPVVLA